MMALPYRGIPAGLVSFAPCQSLARSGHRSAVPDSEHFDVLKDHNACDLLITT